MASSSSAKPDHDTASSSGSNHDHDVDDLYFSALHDDDEIFPISDEKYAYELQLQEALIISSSAHSHAPSSPENKQPLTTSSESVSVLPSSPKNKQPLTTSSESVSVLPSSPKNKQPLTTSSESASVLPDCYCGICTGTKKSSEVFRNTNACSHLYCSDCIRSYVAAKIKENLTIISCPDPDCKAVIGPEVCRSVVPEQVLERWENVLCENVIMEGEKFYCPFKDCSAMLVKDGDEAALTSSECPYCHRLFCVQCKVAWHSGIDCREFQSLNKGEKISEDLMLMDLANSKKWMRCSKCKFFVERTSGCLHMSCRCGHEFCYGCGQAYNSTHQCPAV